MAFPFAISQTFIENWPPELAELSFPHEVITLSLDDVMALGSFTPEFRQAMNAYDDYELSEELLNALENGVAKFPEGVMPRIGYCSWKDSSLINEPARSVRHLLSIITRPNVKIANALIQDIVDKKETSLFLRRWVDIPAWSEFRIFMKERKIYGISQYYHRDKFPEIEQNMTDVRNSLYKFCEKIYKNLHVDAVVVDVFLDKIQNGIEVRLIELNPYDLRTDPCLYSWRYNDFDGQLRFRRGGRVMCIGIV